MRTSNVQRQTGARYGLITTVDEAGRPRRFVGSGFTEAQYRRLEGWADRPRLFQHLAGLRGALSFEDIPGYLRRRGFGTGVLPYGSARGARIDCGGTRVGYLFVVDKEDGQDFTDGDDEVLPLFASQAGTAIANARAFRDERRARGRLEALVSTSPVGVVVLDAGTGGGVSVNREAKRIAEGLRMPDRSMEQLIEIVTCRRERDRPGGLPAGSATAGCRDGSRRGDRTLGARRPERADARQFDADPRARRRGRVGGGHDAGPGPVRGDGADADGVPWRS